MNSAARTKTALSAGAWRAKRNPACRASANVSGRALWCLEPSHLKNTQREMKNKTALIRNTAAGPAAAIRSPPTAGPIARDTLTLTPTRVMAWGNSLRETRSGCIACQVGRSAASPIPRAKVSASRSQGVIAPSRVASPSAKATSIIQPWLATRSQRRSTMSPSTPAGKAATRKGRLVDVWTSVTSVGAWESEVISHAAPTFCIQMPKFDTRAASHRARKRDERRGAQVDKVSLDADASTAAYMPSGEGPPTGTAPCIMFSISRRSSSERSNSAAGAVP